jgi:integrase
MPYTLKPPKAGRSPYWRVRGTEFGIYVNRSTQTRDRREAAKILSVWREEAKCASVSDTAPAQGLSFSAAALAYMRANGEARFLASLLRHFGETPLPDITQDKIDEAATLLYPEATAATRNRQVYSPLSAVMKHAGVERVIRRPKGWRSRPRVHWLRPEQAFALLASANALHARFGALLTFLLYCGPRLSEALRLEWADVDLAGRTALLRRTKNGCPITLSLPPIVVAALANLDADGGCVFRLAKSGRLYALLAAAERASGVELPARTAFHILRHSHATWRRRETGADTTALVETGLWKSRESAAVYEHLDAGEEARKSDLFPTPSRAKSGWSR